MPGKSRHGKGKHFHYSKRSKALRRQAAAAASGETAAALKIPGPAAPVMAQSVPKAAVSPAAKTTANPYPYITTELRRIGILGAIIIVLLVVLSVVLT